MVEGIFDELQREVEELTSADEDVRKQARHRMQERQKARTDAQRAMSTFSRAARRMHLLHQYEREKLFSDVLDSLIWMAGALPAEHFADDHYQGRWWLGDAQRLVEVIEQQIGKEAMRERIEQMENTDGRTPEEAELYRAKAAELRERHGVKANKSTQEEE